MTDLGAKQERSKMLRTHCQTSGVSLTEQDPYNNVMRTTIEAMAAMLGGTQSLHTNALDEAIALPTDFSARIARNTQIVIQEETGMCNVVDPLGGSYYIEALTKELVDKASEIIDRVEAEGGMAKAVAAGWPKAMIEEAAAARQARVDRGEDVIVGVNKFRLKDEDSIEILEVDNHKVREAQIASIQKVKAERDAPACQASFDSLSEGAKGTGHLLAAAARQARVDRGEDVIVGVNKFRLKDEDSIEILEVDNHKVREAQIARIQKVKAGRDETACQAALDALREGAKGTGNLLALAVDAARKRATLGEISQAMEDAFGRYDTVPKPVKGVYGGAYANDDRWTRVVDGVDAFERRKGRKPRMLVAKMGQDGHDRGANVIASAFRSEEHTSELQSLMRSSYAVFCLQKKTTKRMYR